MQFMLDLETLGTTPSCPVASIAVVAWSGDSPLKIFYRRVIFDPTKGEEGTMRWWDTQSESAKKEVFDASPTMQTLFTVDDKFNPEFAVKTPLRQCLLELNEWVKSLDYRFSSPWWSQGSAFDFPILEDKYRQEGLLPPWKFWMVRDTRTAFDICGVTHVKSEGAHHAVVDCIDQINTLKRALKK